VEAGQLVRTALVHRSAGGRGDLPRQVVAAGKAACPMIAALAEDYPIDWGLVAVPAGSVPPPGGPLDVIVAGHPAPDQGSAAAGARALALARDGASRGGLLVLLSGGASAMLALPAEGLTLEDKAATARALMEAGAAIDELNCVRKHLSRIKGGQLAAAAGRTVTLALSDVHAPRADDPSVIGSGPTVPDPTTFADALEIVRERRVEIPPAALVHLSRGARGELPETSKPGDVRVTDSEYVVIGNRHTAAAGARDEAERRGYQVIVEDTAIAGEARESARAWVNSLRPHLGRPSRPVCVIGSGETTVTVRGNGRGGRNQEFALGGAVAVATLASNLQCAVLLASAGTDGVDGPTDAAGAVVDQTTLARAARARIDPDAALARNDAYAFFEPLGDLIRWGPTGTNVGDLQILLVGATGRRQDGP